MRDSAEKQEMLRRRRQLLDERGATRNVVRPYGADQSLSAVLERLDGFVLWHGDLPAVALWTNDRTIRGWPRAGERPARGARRRPPEFPPERSARRKSR